jgi:protein-disulfide isomerase
MNKTKWIIFTLLVVAVFGAVIWVNKSKDATTFNGDTAKIITDGPIADQVYGTRDQKVVLIEYGDYQCPACGTMYEPTKQIVEKYKDKVTFIFRNLPLTNIHPNALAASTAAEAAGLQGKFWEMHDKLYEAQESWSNVAVDQREAVFTGYASDIGLDVDQFKKDLSSTDIKAKINRDEAAAKGVGANSTPTFVLNGTKLESKDAVDAQALLAKVEDAIKQAYPEPATP